MLNPDILNHLVCPLGKKELKLEDNFLVCTYCKVKYPIIEGIPVLLIDDAILPEEISSADELKCQVK